jgi:hypothetical protein
MAEEYTIIVAKDGTFEIKAAPGLKGASCVEKIKFLNALGNKVNTQKTAEFYKDDSQKNMLRRGE